MVKIFAIGRFLSSVDSSKLIFTRYYHSKGSCFGSGARGQYLGHHTFVLCREDLLMDEYYTWDVGSVWHKHWPEFMYICQWPIFHGPVILFYILKIICYINAIIGTLVPCDAKIYLINCMWVSELHFMVQWFCLISWGLFDGLMMYWRYWFSVTQTLNWNYIC